LTVPLSAHASRWAVAAVLIPLVLGLLFLAPPSAFDLLIIVTALLAWREFFSICFDRRPWVLQAIGLGGAAMIMIGARLYGPVGQGLALVLAVALGFLYFLLNYGQTPSIIDSIGRFSLGHVYVSLFLSFFVRLHALDHGAEWIFFTLAVTFLGDTAAFYVGRSFGRRPFYPAVSPKKTWEGFGGGLIGSGLSAGLVGGLLLPAAWFEAALFGIFLGIWGATGDLFESMLKRSAGIKDSGSVLLGHGGILDRIDALLFNGPFVYLYAVTRGGGLV